jgi:hypothetical protein
LKSRVLLSVLGLLTAASVAAFGAPDSYVFGFTDSGVSGATLTVNTDGGPSSFAVPFDNVLGKYDQGWWSGWRYVWPGCCPFNGFGSAGSDNDNYFVGYGDWTLNDFFSFDLSGFHGGATSAYLTIAPTGSGANWDGGTYAVGGVSTAASILDDTNGVNWAIWADLGKGNYGSYVFGAAYPDSIVIELDSAAVTDINAAAGGWFSIGGTFNPVIPEPGSFALLGMGLVTLGVALRRRRRA